MAGCRHSRNGENRPKPVITYSQRKRLKTQQKQPQPDLQLRADKATHYKVIAQVVAAAQNNGLTEIGVVSQPKEK